MDLRPLTFRVLALALPFGMLALHHDVGHEGDIRFFYDWYLAIREGSAFYRDGPGINYPIGGALLVGLPGLLAELLSGGAGPIDYAVYRLVWKTFGALGEVALIFAAAEVARVLHLKRPFAVAIGLYLLPSTWAGGAWFGQTDQFGTALLLLSALGLIRYRRGGRRSDLALGLMALHGALLLKQLTWFAAPGLGLLALLGLLEHRDRGAWLGAACSPLVWFVADPWLALPSGYVSHLHFVIAGGGSSHGDVAVASGASLWALAVPGGTPARSVTLLGLDAFVWGWALFVLVMLVALYGLTLARDRDRALVRLAGVGQLAMATLLTGVHERYLAHAIPLLLLSSHGATPRAALGIATGMLGGAFVLSTLHGPAFVGPLAWLAHPGALALVSFLWLLSELAPRLAPAPRPTRSVSGTLER